jgi:hypothetical protein
MNCNPKNQHDHLVAKILGWREVANCGVDHCERVRGRRNLRRLANTHPEIAADCGIGGASNEGSGSTEFQIPGLDV